MENKSRSPMKKRLRRTSLLFLSPSLLGVLVFFVLPFFMVVYYSIVSMPVHGRFVGLDNFKALFHNAAFLLGLKNTSILCFLAVPLAVMLSLGLALLLDRQLPLSGALRTAFLSPMLAPAASIILIWQVLFHQNGAVNAALAALGLSGVDWFHSAWGRMVVVLLYLWRNLGYYILLFTAALAAVPRDLVDMAAMDGAGPVRRFFSVKLPCIAPTTLFVTMLSLISAMKIFREVFLLTGEYPDESLYLLQHFMNNTFYSMDYQKLSAAALVLLLIMGVVVALLFRLERRVGGDIENG